MKTRGLMRLGVIPAVTPVLVVLVAACGSPDQPPSERSVPIVLHGFTLIDGNGSDPLPNAYVVLKGERIAEVGSGRPPEIGAATYKNLPGRYVVPGFVDAHLHVDTPAAADQQILSTAINFGITSIRDTGPNEGKGVTVRQRIESGELTGPRMKTTGVTIDAPGRLDPGYPIVNSVAEIRAEVRRQLATGADGIKLYMFLQPELVRAAVDEAHAHGAFVVGHLLKTSWTEAALAGIDALVHSGSEGPTWELMPGETGDFIVPGDWKGSLLFWALHAQEFDLDGPEFSRLLSALVENDVEVNPTLVLTEALANGDTPTHLEVVEPQYADDALKALWGEGWRERNPFMAAWQLTSAEFEALREAFPALLEMIRRFHEAGVLLTAGSDVSMPWVVPGVSLHRELYLLNSAGIPTRDVLVIATRNGAEALGILDETGTIEAGKSADLVVLGRDPIANIENTRTIEFVMFRGEVYSGYRSQPMFSSG